MPGRRDRVDPETVRLIEQRLERLLAEHPPRRASADQASRPVPDVAEEPTRRLGPVLEPAAAKPPSDGPPAGGLGRVLDFTRAHLGVVATLAVLALLSAGWVVLRARPVALASTPMAALPSPTLVSRGAAPGGSASAGSPTAARLRVIVHVLGAVRKPGLVSLPEHSRVQDAINAAGGLRRNADPGQLNLAQLLIDGQQVVVGTVEHPTGEVRHTGAAGSPEPTGDVGSGVVDLNTATQEQLEGLPGVGPVTAGKILAWRAEHGRFSRVEELQEVSGIGPKTFAEIAPHCRV